MSLSSALFSQWEAFPSSAARLRAVSPEGREGAVGFACLSVEVRWMDVVTPGPSMALSGRGGRGGGEGYSRYAFPVLHL